MGYDFGRGSRGRYEDGQLLAHEADRLISLARRYNPAVVLEIGTYFGHTTRRLAEALPEAVIHTLDLPRWAEVTETEGMPKSNWELIARRDVGREYRGLECESRIRQWYGDSAEWDWDLARGATFMFIDGSHTYEYCRNDSEKCWDLCGGRGVIVWHDVAASSPGVVRLVSEWRQIGRAITQIPGTWLAYYDGLTRVKSAEKSLD
jgi:predicted O-methyltransferase YrrM